MKLGLTLSGGGIKGMFHLGLLQYYNEQGIEFDVLSGTSAGSIVSIFYALGLSPIEIKEKVIKIKFRQMPSVWKIFGKAGLINPLSMKDVIHTLILNEEEFSANFTDLKKPVYLPSTNMLTGKSEIFSPEHENKTTHVIEAVIASSAYPFVFSPVELKDQLYSDGGILNNFPADLIADKVDYLLGVYLSPVDEINKDELTSSKDVVLRALSLQGQEEEIKFKLCNDIVNPQELSQFATFDFDDKVINELYELGYNTAKNNEMLTNKLKKLMRYKKIII